MNMFSVCHLMKFFAITLIPKLFPASENDIMFETKGTIWDHFMRHSGFNVRDVKF